MKVVRNEIRTGLLVAFTLAALAGILIYLGAPGVFTAQRTYGIYFDNVAGIKIGTRVMLAGRQVGQVAALQSPIPAADRPKGMPQAEALIEVHVDHDAQIYNVCKVQLASYNLLGEPVIDFTGGDERSGRAAEWAYFEGERPGGLADTGTQIIQKLDPVIAQLGSALNSLETTANNVTKLTNDGADLPVAIAEIRKIAGNLTALTGPDGSLNKALTGLENLAKDDGSISETLKKFQALIGPDSSLGKALKNIENVTNQLASTDDIGIAMRNFRQAGEKLSAAVSELRVQFGTIGNNLEQATDTVKRQPWRMIWPSTKKYERGAPPPTPTPGKKRR